MIFPMSNNVKTNESLLFQYIATNPNTKEPRNLPPDGTTFNQISLGPKQRLIQTLPAYGYWNVQFYQMEAAYVHFDFWLPRGGSLGFYARRNALPTHTNYDLMEVVKGSNSEATSRTSRSVQVNKKMTL
jgi:hypothetical protein